LRVVAQNRGTIIVPAWWRLVCWLNGTASQLFERGVASGLNRIMSEVVRPGAPPSKRSTPAARETRDHRAGS
jgi:hypothetical protein